MLFRCNIFFKNNDTTFIIIIIMMCQNYGNCLKDFVFIHLYLKENYPNWCRFQIYNSYKKGCYIVPFPPSHLSPRKNGYIAVFPPRKADYIVGFPPFYSQITPTENLLYSGFSPIFTFRPCLLRTIRDNNLQ